MWIYTVFTGVFNLGFLQLCIEYLALVTLAWVFIRGINACAISSNMSRHLPAQQHISTNIIQLLTSMR